MCVILSLLLKLLMKQNSDLTYMSLTGIPSSADNGKLKQVTYENLQIQVQEMFVGPSYS